MPFLQRPDGCRLYFEVHGPSEGAPLFLLEGRGGDIPGWRRNIPRLSERFRVVALDSRGNGLSDKPPGRVTMSVFVDDTLALMNELGLPDGHLYGQSFGGMVAMETALSYPGRIRSLVLACTHAGHSLMVPARNRAKVPKDKPYLALYSPTFAREHPQHVAEDILVGGQNPQPMHASRRQWEAIQDWDAWDRLAQIRCPTLILHGTEDIMVDVENALLMAERISAAELVLLEGAGHVYHSEQPERADSVVLDFLDRVETRR
jgi:pimeloyl-ACP methyl ester carboxylesterase